MLVEDLKSDLEMPNPFQTFISNLFNFSPVLHFKSHLIFRAKQMTAFYMKCNAGLKRV